ncbi:MAG: class I SAM-dependent methyltransferase [Ignavibacteriae bacterium]|nr:class I SAM-dependent methyltransferase [Ignavibacteria bacterium]MBI3365027.1 class I SAM-dependent methyltransferase [Ignavibacteriota bacterium]
MNNEHLLNDTGERMIPTGDGEVSFVFARHRFAYQYARQFVEGKSVIDLGCGTGYGCKMLAESAAFVQGIDHDARAIDFCRKNYPASNIRYAQMDAASLSLDRRFDVAVSFQVIEHLSAPGTFIDQIKNIVEPGGTIIISTPNVRTPTKASNANPFHYSEMNYQQFEHLLSTKFRSFNLHGVGYAAPNRLRVVMQSLPFYRHVGRLFKRTSSIKKIAGAALDMTNFRVMTTDIARDAIDLLAICRNE